MKRRISQLLAAFSGTTFFVPAAIFAENSEEKISAGTTEIALSENAQPEEIAVPEDERGLVDIYGDFLLTEIFTPARSLFLDGTNVVMPLYVFYSQRIPASTTKGGKISATTYGAGFSWQHVSPQESHIALSSIDLRRRDYRFTGTTERISPLGNAPFGSADSFNFFTWQEWVFDKENGHSLCGFFSGTLACEEHTAFKNGASAAIGFGVKQYFSRETAIWLGAALMYSRARERWQIFPFGMFNHAFSKNWNLRLGNGIQISWDTFGDDTFLLSSSLNYSGDTITIARGESWQGQAIPLSVTAQWNLTKELFVAFSTEALLWQKFRLWSGGSRTNYKFSADPTLDFSLQIGLRF